MPGGDNRNRRTTGYRSINSGCGAIQIYVILLTLLKVTLAKIVTGAPYPDMAAYPPVRRPTGMAISTLDDNITDRPGRLRRKHIAVPQ